MAKRKGAYVTFLAGDGDYVKATVGLAKGLRKVKAAYPLVVTMLPDVPESHRRLLTRKAAFLGRLSLCIHPRLRLSLPWPIMSSTTPSFAFGRSYYTLFTIKDCVLDQ